MIEESRRYCAQYFWERRYVRGSSVTHRRSFCPDSCRKAQVVSLHSCSRDRAFSSLPYLRMKYWRDGEASICSAVRYHGAAASEGVADECMARLPPCTKEQTPFLVPHHPPTPAAAVWRERNPSPRGTTAELKQGSIYPGTLFAVLVSSGVRAASCMRHAALFLATRTIRYD